MIKANELRIDNWVRNTKENFWYGNRPIGQVKTIHTDGINHWQDMGASGVMKWEDLQGIPITKEILLNAGFIPYAHLREAYTIDGNYIFQFNNYILISHFPTKHTFISHHILYVHQLQNFHFSLTGKELPIEL